MEFRIFQDWEVYILTFCISSLDAVIPKINVAPPKTIAVATANAEPTAKKVPKKKADIMLQRNHCHNLFINFPNSNILHYNLGRIKQAK